MSQPTKYIRVGRIIDGSGTPVRRNMLLKIRDGRLEALLPAASLKTLPHDAQIEDLSHCTLVPALVDCSVSLLQSPALNLLSPLSSKGEDQVVTQEKQQKLLERHISYCFSHGIMGLVVTEKDQLVQTLQRKKGEKENGADGIILRTAHDAPGADFLRVQYSSDIEEEAESFLLPSHEQLSRILKQRGDKKAIVVANGPQQVSEACNAIEQGGPREPTKNG